MPNAQQIHNRFTCHVPSEETRKVHRLVSKLTKKMGLSIIELTEESREQALALTALEEVRMRWNQAVAMDGRGFSPQDR